MIAPNSIIDEFRRTLKRTSRRQISCSSGQAGHSRVIAREAKSLLHRLKYSAGSRGPLPYPDTAFDQPAGFSSRGPPRASNPKTEPAACSRCLFLPLQAAGAASSSVNTGRRPHNDCCDTLGSRAAPNEERKPRKAGARVLDGISPASRSTNGDPPRRLCAEAVQTRAIRRHIVPCSNFRCTPRVRPVQRRVTTRYRRLTSLPRREPRR